MESRASWLVIVILLILLAAGVFFFLAAGVEVEVATTAPDAGHVESLAVDEVIELQEVERR